MRNIVGQTPRGEDFFPRPRIVNRIYRRLEGGANIYLAAPRRVGKTAIMRHLEDSPRDNYEFKYIITESVDDPTTYFERLLNALRELKGISKKSLEAVGNFLKKIAEIGVAGVKIRVDQKEQIGPYRHLEELKTLLRSLDTNGTKVVIMIDEFPQTVENIQRKDGEGAAQQFLQFNRELRHHDNTNICFMITGSIGLPSLAEKLDATRQVNDLNTIEIPPLSREEAMRMTTALLAHEKVSYQDGTIEYLLDKLEWNIPFHIQLFVQELIDMSDASPHALGNADVDDAFDKITQKRNDIYFEHYYSRLQKTFTEAEYAFAIAVLDQLTQQDALSLQEIQAIAKDRQCEKYPTVLRTLIFDGYLFHSEEGETVYRFTSPVLRLWWKRYVKADI